ncbi:hypothetical protein KL930_000922 [Ogataea haglerorum]|nr:hypothetical protein KL915_000923 [Ogataea haglerorum]KAG7711705.1 hypothetical protein KL914_000347 [Ogataea haglerorum]KAG7712478.1 hypothetical protein KL950_000349 [Ogataea haglerorum]KAG7722529.1 hypothetical protein KL913_000349 [Ogataea haglerorum]KAG7734781.1 hypothetical protein KL948_000347 [Ogataea haglerorum]
MSQNAPHPLGDQLMNPSMHENGSSTTLQDSESVNTLLSRTSQKNGSLVDLEPRDTRDFQLTGGESPALLATSVGFDSQGHLVTSASNISLLSLNQQVATLSSTPSNLQRTFTNPRLPLLQPSSASAAPQQQQYYRRYSFTSPKTSGRAQPMAIHAAPDSPSLIPTSLAASPSNFNLNQSSPPNSLKSRSSSYINAPSLRLNTRFPTHLPLTRTESVPNSIGGRSPEFLPCSLSMPPMTPLNLSMPAVADESPFDNESDPNSQGSYKSGKSPSLEHYDGPVFAEQIQDTEL